MKTKLYPLTFDPILKETIWGGHQIEPYKNIPRSTKKIGESWEISMVPGSISTVNDGPLKGQRLDQLTEAYQSLLLGEHVWQQFNTSFPLLIKFIDAADDLSIQVHPNDKVAHERHQSFGKTEMWYVVGCHRDARLKIGFSQALSQEDFKQKCQDGSITEALSDIEVKPGEVYFLPAGRIHAIGKGCFVAEIQQTSDITYRVFDYKRKDANGQERKLHLNQALDVIDYKVYEDYSTPYQLSPNKDEHINVTTCQYFCTSVLQLKKEMNLSLKERDSFSVFMVLEGSIHISCDDYSKDFEKGTTILIPACINKIQLKNKSCDCSKILETYVP